MMAKFEEEILFDTVSIAKYFQLPICQVEDCFVANTGRNSISSIQISSKKSLQTWTLKQPHTFTSPVVYNAKDNTLLSVFDRKVLISWDYCADSLYGAKKVKFHDPIFAIITPVGSCQKRKRQESNTGKDDVQVIVFVSGTCFLLEDALSAHNLPTEQILEDDEHLTWAGCALEGSSAVVYMLTKSQEDVHKLHSVLLSKDKSVVLKSTCKVISREDATLKSWCLGSGGHSSFIAAWSDGKIFCYLDDNEPSKHLLSLPDVESKDAIAVEALDSMHLAVVKFNSSKKKLSDGKNRNLDDNEPYKHLLSLLSVKGSDGENLNLDDNEPYKHLLSLLSVKGKEVKGSDGAILYFNDNEPSKHLLSLPSVKGEEQIEVKVVEIWDLKFGVRKALKVIESPFSNYQQVKNLDTMLFITSNQGIIGMPFQLSYADLASVVGKCPVDGNTKAKVYSLETDGTVEEIEESEVNCNFSGSTYHDWLKRILSELGKSHTATIAEYVLKLKGIPELHLVLLLQTFLRFRKTCAKNSHILVQYSDRKCYIGRHILALFHIPFTEAFILEHLSNMSFEETLETLEILFCLLNKHKLYQSSQAIPDDFDAYLPTKEQIFLWIDQLMESHVKDFWTNEELVSSFGVLMAGLHEIILEGSQEDQNLLDDMQFAMTEPNNITYDKPVEDSYSIEICYL